jgi:hypothetical protein
MRGMLITRAASPDGRFAYTLYAGAGEHRFIHALDTVGRTAHCIDFPGLTGFEDLYPTPARRLAERGTITILNGPDPVAFVDTRTDEVMDPAQLAEALPTAAEPRSIPWPHAAAASALAFGLTLVLIRRFAQGWIRRRSPEPSDLLAAARPEPTHQPSRTRRRQPRGGAKRSRTLTKP